MPRKKTKQILGLGNLSSPYKEDLNLSRKKSKKMKKSSIEKHDIDNVAYSDNNEDICTVCKSMLLMFSYFPLSSGFFWAD